MKNFTKKIACLVIVICISMSVFAGDFIPKEYKYSAVGVTSRRTINIPMTDLFEYPEEIASDANLDNVENLTVEIDPKNTELIDLYKYEYYSYGKSQYLYLWHQANQKGLAEVDIKITYNGTEITNTLVFDIKGIMATDDSYDLPLDGKPFIATVLTNDQAMNTSQRNNGTITIDLAPTLGTATVIPGVPSTIQYIPNANLSNYSTDFLKYTITLEDGESSSATAKFFIHHNSFASRVIEFLPAPGQFTNEAIAKSGSGENILGTKGGMVSLGGFGGYIILGFDQAIVNRPENPYGVDFSVKGNSFAANLYGAWTEPGAVMVMKDVNKNGIPDDGEWYELAGSDYWLSTTRKNVEMTYYNPHYDVRYTIPWSTNQGDKGAQITNQFHSHSYYPNPFDFGCDRDSLTYSGNMILSSLDMSTKSYVNFYRAPMFGYCDNRGNSTDLRVPNNPYYGDEKGNAADGFDLNWAVDRNGNHVELDSVHFVKIYTAGSANAGWLGEWSTEVLGVGITTPNLNYVPQDYYINYLGITQLKVLKGQDCQYEGILFKNGRPINEGTPKWWTSNPEVGTVDNTGKFTAVGNGVTGLYFSQKDDIAVDSIQVKVVELKSVVLEMEGNSALSSDSTSLIQGETIYITAQCEDNIGDVLNGNTSNRFTYETFDWTVSDKEIGTINNGLFKGLQTGRTMVYAASQSNPELKDSILVIVNKSPDIKIVTNTITISDPDKFTGSLKCSELFTMDNKSVVYLNSAMSLNDRMFVEIKNDSLKYGLLARSSLVEETVRLNVTSYGMTQDMDVKFIFNNLTTGIENDFNENNISVYPNPFTDYIIVNNENEDTAYLYSVTGQCLIEQQLSIGENRINTFNLPKGIYVLKTKSTSIKLIK